MVTYLDSPSCFYAAKEYSEVVKCSEEFILTLTKGQNNSLEIFFPGRGLGFPLKIFYYNGDATNEETKVDRKKVQKM